MKHRLDIPMLMVETDATKQCEGQIRTRVEAFIESLKIAKGASIGKKSLKKAEDGKMYVVLCQDLVQVKMRNFSPF